MRLRQRLGIDRMLADKFSRDVPDLRTAASEAERLATLVGSGGRVTADLVEREVEAIEGGARYELASLFTEGKMVEAVGKLRDLVAQARRDDPRAPADILYGRFLFPLADEIRQMIAIRSYARTKNIDLRAPMTYNRFKDTVADALGDYMKNLGSRAPAPASVSAAQEVGGGALALRRRAVSRARDDRGPRCEAESREACRWISG